ncbi:hypothetical protein [Streptomyces sp. NRRL S-448]|uniref:hypothetical protein n=1 Tax=Streptomyces sp. NRRL S-448 TaxID=1463907 RepID=UPI000B120E59
MTAPALLYALCAAAHGSSPPLRRETEAGRGLAGAMLLPGSAGPPGGRAGIRPTEALRRVRRSVEEPDRSVLRAVAAGALLAPSGLHDLCWPGLSRDEAPRRTLRAVAAPGSGGLPVARAATAASPALSGSAGAFAFPGQRNRTA